MRHMQYLRSPRFRERSAAVPPANFGSKHPALARVRAVRIAMFAGVIGCAFVQPFLAANAARFQERVLYSFCSKHKCTDGKYPSALIGVNGELYGTTASGGHTGCRAFGCGTAFSLDPKTGAETVLYSFCSRRRCRDGQSPSESLIESNDKLYGTTFWGGHSFYGRRGYGTVFALDPNTDVEKVLYSFCSQYNCTDGSNPTSLIDVQGTLYGTTETGGTGFDGSA